MPRCWRPEFIAGTQQREYRQATLLDRELPGSRTILIRDRRGPRRTWPSIGPGRMVVPTASKVSAFKLPCIRRTNVVNLRDLAADLYSGVTPVKSGGDPLDLALKVRMESRSSSKLRAESYTTGLLFTAEATALSTSGAHRKPSEK